MQIVASEIHRARAQGIDNTPTPPAPATNARLDILPSKGKLSLSNDGTVVSFEYTPDASCGEHVDTMSFAHECEGRVWHTVVKVISRCGDRVDHDPTKVSVAGRAPEVVTRAAR
jgi:hypothetical protein